MFLTHQCLVKIATKMNFHMNYYMGTYDLSLYNRHGRSSCCWPKVNINSHISQKYISIFLDGRHLHKLLLHRSDILPTCATTTVHRVLFPQLIVYSIESLQLCQEVRECSRYVGGWAPKMQQHLLYI